ncbi:endonuclease/exonuclease/phosphatase family protein [Clostridium butanoliproducens]|uniref:endonuclease/exonuclease/phosphatase family protein n=1 Tax=Clostridium butanoliproducens TaxID=2991837 RepID=UPI0024BA6ECC|nr:endonuclease/exonuclease/phosphatase family protein [Clostridium butanoliproducens]
MCLKWVLRGIAAIVIVIIGYFLFMTITDYKPDEILEVEIKNNKREEAKLNSLMTVMTYNIGYCGMDKDVDFFMDGGKGSRSLSKEKTLENLEESFNVIKEENPTFVFLQEVDKKATRSYKVDQYDYLMNNLDEYSSSFAINYKVLWVPVPIQKPHGSVLAGLASFSKLTANKSTRYSLPGKESWPKQLADLDRCILVNRVSVENGKELILINLHLSAYDKGGKIRKQQLDFLSSFLQEEYKKGNYIVAGGDFNHQIPGSESSTFEATEEFPDWIQTIPKNFKPEGFNWYFDKENPTARSVVKPYKKGENFRTIIDGFLASDNVEVISTKTKDLDFIYSDHNPVILNFKLK